MAELVSVKLRKGEHFNKLLSRFKRKVKKSEHLLELRKRKEFIKPSAVKRKKKLQVIRENELAVRIQKFEDGDNTIKLYNNKRKKKK